MKKTIILNNTGNVGKTLITREVIAANNKDAFILEIETCNSSNSNFSLTNKVEKFSQKDFNDFYHNFHIHEHLVVDVGSSNIIGLLETFRQYNLLNELFDLIIIPTTSENKQMEDTLVTILVLINELKVSPNKIKVVCNKTHSLEDEVEKEFDIIFKAARKIGFIVNSNLKISEVSSLKLVEKEKKTIKQFLEEKNDYIKLSTDIEEIKKYEAIKSLSKEFKTVYDELYKD